MNSTFAVSAGALQANFRAFRSLTSAKILQVVKANAYGHGLQNVVTSLVSEGIDAFGVVNVSEAEELRKVAPSTEILLLGAVPIKDFLTAHELNCVIPIWRREHIEAAVAAGKILGRAAKVQIKIDTGMGRLGLFPDQLSSLLDRLVLEPLLHVNAIYTHFHTADGLADDSYLEQLSKFESCVRETKERFGEDVIAHAANSPGFLRDSETHLDMVRIGIAGYGVPPDTGFTLPDAVQPVGRWVSELVEVKTVPKGHGLSYGSEFIAPTEMLIGIVPVGYADGFHRVPPSANVVRVRGKLVDVVGRVCMDHFIVDLRSVDEANLGDEVELLSCELSGDLSVIEIAKRWGTNEYDVLANIGSRVDRQLVD